MASRRKVITHKPPHNAREAGGKAAVGRTIGLSGYRPADAHHGARSIDVI
jgi:hypothetical protein